MMNSQYVFLQDIRLHAFHGVAEQERIVGNDFKIDIRLKCDLQRAANTDNVADTVNYADVYQVIKDEMSIPSSLLENVCGRIIKHIFKEFQLVEEINISLSKCNPPMGADIACAGVEMQCSRNQLT